MPSRKKRRGRSPKKANEPQNSLGDDGDEDSAKNQRIKSEEEEEEVLACPHCEKEFTTTGGLSYHLDKKVCQQPAKGGRKKKKGNTEVASAPDPNEGRTPRRRGKIPSYAEESEEEEEEESVYDSGEDAKKSTKGGSKGGSKGGKKNATPKGRPSRRSKTPTKKPPSSESSYAGEEDKEEEEDESDFDPDEDVKKTKGGKGRKGSKRKRKPARVSSSSGKKDKSAEFGNPHHIKAFKKHKMPPWLVFDAQRSSMYPEIYVSLEFRRGSQNRNYFTKVKQEDGYVPRTEKSRLRKKLKNLRKSDPATLPLAEVPAAEKKTPKQVNKAKKRQQPPKQTEESIDLGLPSLPPALPPLPSIGNIDDTTFEAGNDSPAFDAAPSPPMLPEGASNSMAKAKETTNRNNKKATVASSFKTKARETDLNTKKAAAASSSNDMRIRKRASSSEDNNSRRKKRVPVSKKNRPTVIDTQVLATECESGRYPTINRFYGDHEQQCTLCKKPEDDPLINCEFCKNAVHQICLDTRMLLKDPQIIIRENEPMNDTAMCHECINVCLFRRARAENRRVMKWQHELSKAGLDHAPEAANLTEEVNLKDSGDDLGEEAGVDDEPTYQPCPDGGPGGLICCSYCTAAYSRFLSNTAEEMEAQSVARAGQEVSEILELLSDAKQRLQRASDVSQSNEERRGLLDKNQSAHHSGVLP